MKLKALVSRLLRVLKKYSNFNFLTRKLKSVFSRSRVKNYEFFKLVPIKELKAVLI